jgi:hypothetical protein
MIVAATGNQPSDKRIPTQGQVKQQLVLRSSIATCNPAKCTDWMRMIICYLLILAQIV